ncbi:unnamed protein product [Rotaria sp. Silwood1]|nr:unnamed protein product [Rotaria sp. Silwood1]
MTMAKSIIRTDSLSTDRVNGDFDEDFVVCSICSNILWKPIAWQPSAPPYESPSPTNSEIGSSTLFSQVAAIRNGPLRISTINFAQIPRAIKNGGHIPNGYAGFNWENAYYMFEDFVKARQLKGFTNAFVNSRQYVAYNGRGDSMSFSLCDQSKTFGLHSFEAISIYHEDFKLSVAAYRVDVLFDTKFVMLTTAKATTFEMDWEQIDKVVFKPERNLETLKPETFALTCLNLLL